VKFKKRISFSALLVLSILGVCLAAPILAPYDPNAIGVAEAFSGPTAANWMGADDLGRDLFSRILYGGRITILIAIAATVVALVVGFLLSPTTARMARSAVVTELASDYVTAAIASGTKRSKLILSEVMPNIAPQLLVQLSINAAAAVMLEATLSFIGLGIQPPNASWGTLMLQGYAKIWNTYWFVFFPALAVTITILAFNAYGERIRVNMDSRRSSV